MKKKIAWSFESARVPATFTAVRRPAENHVEHAAGGAETLCGIPMTDVIVYRHLFASARRGACPSCQREAAKAPTRPCVQERLHDVLDGGASALRDELREALRAGAKVPFWVSGPGASMLKHYVKLDQIVEGREAVAAMDGFGGRLGVVRVAAARRYLVLIPDSGVPLVAIEE